MLGDVTAGFSTSVVRAEVGGDLCRGESDVTLGQISSGRPPWESVHERQGVGTVQPFALPADQLTSDVAVDRVTHTDAKYNTVTQ